MVLYIQGCGELEWANKVMIISHTHIINCIHVLCIYSMSKAICVTMQADMGCATKEERFRDAKLWWSEGGCFLLLCIGGHTPGKKVTVHTVFLHATSTSAPGIIRLRQGSSLAQVMSMPWWEFSCSPTKASSHTPVGGNLCLGGRSWRSIKFPLGCDPGQLHHVYVPTTSCCTLSVQATVAVLQCTGPMVALNLPWDMESGCESESRGPAWIRMELEPDWREEIVYKVATV